MIKNDVYYELFASKTVPNPDQVGYWIDLGANSKGKVIKIYNPDTEKWVKLTDATSEDAVAPFIGTNGNWWVDDRDTGVPAAGKNPYIGENNHWFIFDPLENEYIDTGIFAKGLSAYELAVKHGFEGTEEEWIASLSKASEDAAIIALGAAKRANEAADRADVATEKTEQAIDDANAAADRNNEIANNPPKIVNEEWYVYDELTKEYKPTGVKAIGDAFSIKKEYPSVRAMEDDYDNPDILVGQFVIINTNNVEDPDDSKLYLKSIEGWKFVVDMSGARGIRGYSAYEVAVHNGFVGTEKEWVDSLSQDSKDAAAEALKAKEQVEETERQVKAAEAARVIAENNRVAAEEDRVDAEDIRIANENARKDAESKRVTAEESRVAAENIRVSNENLRKSAETARENAEASRVSAESGRVSAENNRVNQENARVASESARVENENNRKTAETARINQENIRQSNETTRQTNETTRQNNEIARETAEAKRQEDTAAAIASATTAAANANTQADRAKGYADNPPKIVDRQWWVYDESTKAYKNTNVYAIGEAGKSPIIRGNHWWTYDNTLEDYTDTGITASVYVLELSTVSRASTWTLTNNDYTTFRSVVEENSAIMLRRTSGSTVDYVYPYYVILEEERVLVYTGSNQNLGHDVYSIESTNTASLTTTKGIPATEKGTPNGVATLDSNGTVPSSQLPSYVDDVIEYPSKTDFPTTGESGKVYIAADTNITYRWSGTSYVVIGSDLALGETASTAYPGDKGKQNAEDIAAIKTKFNDYSTTTQNDARYLKLTGGTMTNRIHFNSTTPDNRFIDFKEGDTYLGSIGIDENGLMLNNAQSKQLHIKNTGALLYGTDTIWHSGNDGSGSGLDADTVDGKHSSNFVNYTNDINANEYPINEIGYGYVGKGWKLGGGPAISFGNNTNSEGKFVWQMQADTSNNTAWSRVIKSGVASAWKEFAFLDADGKVAKAVIADTATTATTAITANAVAWNNVTDKPTWIGATKPTYTAAEVGALASNGTANAATKLATARTIWGNSFDGTGNVTGVLNSTSNIQTTGQVITNGGGDALSAFYVSNINGKAWMEGIGAYNLSVRNNGEQTPILLAYRENTDSNVKANRLFEFDILNSGGSARFYFKGIGENKFEFIENGKFICKYLAGELDYSYVKNTITHSNEFNVIDEGYVDASYSAFWINYRWRNDRNTPIAAINFGNGSGTSNMATLQCSRVNAPNGFFKESDKRIKSNIEELQFTLEDISKIPTVCFDMHGKRQIGTIAQDVESICPLIVDETYMPLKSLPKDKSWEVKKDGGIDTAKVKIVEYEMFGVISLHGVKLLAKENTKLEQKVSSLEKEVMELKEMVKQLINHNKYEQRN